MVPCPVVDLRLVLSFPQHQFLEQVQRVRSQLPGHFFRVLVQRSVSGEPENNQASFQPVVENEPDSVLVVEYFLVSQYLNVILLTML